MTNANVLKTLAERVVRKEDYVPCAEAFVDTRLPGREGKMNYCIIGPGVAENEKQVVNIVESHGFNVGGVSLPTGKINSLHSHPTAEVFIIFRGDWRFFWGYNGKDGEAILKPGDVISIPTGTFRAFESVGSDDNFMLSFLGEDDPGFVTWANDVIEGAAEFGFYLRHDSSLVDTNNGDVLPDASELMRPLSEEELLKYNRTSPAEMLARVYNVDQFNGHEAAFRDTALPGGEKTLHALIGEGIHEQGEVVAQIINTHSFSLSAIVAEQGNGFLKHKFDANAVLVVGEGQWKITMVENGEEKSFEVGEEDTISVPAGMYRSMEHIGEGRGILYIATSGDMHAEISWSDEVLNALNT